MTPEVLHNKHDDGVGSASEFLLGLARSKGSVRGWARGPEKLYLTLDRGQADTAWGFSCSGGLDLEHWGAIMSGVQARRGERGLWVSVASVRDNTPASLANLRSGDFITRINGRIVFHLSPEDVSRLIKNSGKVLYLDIERNDSKNVLYCNGLHSYSFNFLFEDNWEMKKFLY